MLNYEESSKIGSLTHIERQRKHCSRQLPVKNYCRRDGSGYYCEISDEYWGIVGQCHCSHYEHGDPPEGYDIPVSRCKYAVGTEYERLACTNIEAIGEFLYRKDGVAS